MRWITRSVLAVATTLTFMTAAFGGGGWVPEPGAGYFQIGASRKQADRSWDSEGDSFNNTGAFENHDFRYGYMSGEIGVAQRVSFTFLVTYLDGREGPDGDLEQNAGPSDSWLGVKVALKKSAYPLALRVEVRTPVLYDMEGPYERNLYDDEGNFLGHSPEWRGILKHDYTAMASQSGSLAGGGWWTVETGYTYREGAPADQWPLFADAGFPIPAGDSRIKVALAAVKSLGNDTPRRPDDRFGARPGFNFNDAGMARIGVSWLTFFGNGHRWSVEAGFNKWIWGRSARHYEEPFISLGRRL